LDSLESKAHFSFGNIGFWFIKSEFKPNLEIASNYSKVTTIAVKTKFNRSLASDNRTTEFD